jgi:hypothetical protein
MRFVHARMAQLGARHDAILEFLFGCHTDVAQDGSRELGKEALDEIEPRAVLWSEGEFEAAGGLIGEPGFGFLGDVRGPFDGSSTTISVNVPPMSMPRESGASIAMPRAFGHTDSTATVLKSQRNCK